MSAAVLSPDVAQGLEQLEDAFPGRVHHDPDGAGGTYVTVDDIDLGSRWQPSHGPLSFHLPYNYPAAAIYPFYVPGELALNGTWPPAGLQRVEWHGQPVVQVSLRHNAWNPQVDQAVGSVMQVQAWLQEL